MIVRKIIRNEAGTYEVRGWNLLDGFTYLDAYFEGGCWWSEKYRGNSTKFTTMEDAKAKFYRPKGNRSKDVVVWP